MARRGNRAAVRVEEPGAELHAVVPPGASRTSELDRLIHERIRLGIVSALAVNERLSFNDLKALLRTTDGTLSGHARKPEAAEYICCTKVFEGRVPRTEYRLTETGRRAREGYLAHMEALIRATHGSAGTSFLRNGFVS